VNEASYLAALRTVLDQLDVQISARPGLRFNCGLSSERVEQWERHLSLSLPVDVRELYRWKNGCAGHLTLMPEFRFLTLDDVEAELTDFRASFDRKFLPIFSNGGGDYLYVSLEQTVQGLVYVWRVYEQDFLTPAFDSLLTLAKTVQAGYQEGILTTDVVTSRILNNEGAYEEFTREVTIARDEDWSRLSEKHNPLSTALWEQMRGDDENFRP
jgi:hypothetical protein